MASGLNKTVIKHIVTHRTSFMCFPDYYIVYCDVDNEQLISRLRINLWGSCSVEYSDNHIYIHRVENKNYIDIDFNLMPDKEQYSSSILKEIRGACSEDTRIINEEDSEDYIFTTCRQIIRGN